MTRETFSTRINPKALIVGIQTPENYSIDIESYFEEFRNLVETNGIVYDHEVYMKLRSIEPSTFITKGKLTELICLCEKENIEEVVFSEVLNTQQVKNLKKLLKVSVFDRTELILEIFEKNALSAEGKLQVELAWLQHKKARLAGRGIGMSQQAGHIGGRGPGETQKEKETQHIELHILKIKKNLERLSQVRATQRKQRLGTSTPRFCIIGYTNAGKSSLLNALTKSDVLAENKLFATLDTTTRELFIDGKKKALISDTVGFIQQLPHSLIEAFKSTLDELVYAHLLIHVVDSSNKNWQQHIRVVTTLLKEMGLEQKPLFTVFNKIDLLSEEEKQKLLVQAQEHAPFCLASTLSDAGLQDLLSYLSSWTMPQESSHE
ncbi:MAG: GTPase HflX [candidate division TM6 bacterium GW2011_GWE2_41_16]|nr:MAG: GTPase HflX [candidate division TM6 bacterium GW2011_GWE2_41_16]